MMRIPKDWNCYRRERSRLSGDESNGWLYIPKRNLAIIASNGMGWEHVSVSHPDKSPSWSEMDEIKRLFWEPQDTVMQLHVPESDHINVHPYCLHLWRPIDQQIPRPLNWMVG